MKKLLVVTIVSLAMASLAGCNTCRRMTGGWFNHGDRCEPPPPVDCPPGVPRASMMYPGATTVLPGPIEVTPQQ